MSLSQAQAQAHAVFNKDPKVALNDLVTSKEVELIRDECEVFGQSHNPTFDHTLQVKFKGTMLPACVGRGQTKMEARSQAARQILGLVQGLRVNSKMRVLLNNADSASAEDQKQKRRERFGALEDTKMDAKSSPSLSSITTDSKHTATATTTQNDETAEEILLELQRRGKLTFDLCGFEGRENSKDMITVTARCVVTATATSLDGKTDRAISDAMRNLLAQLRVIGESASV